jgi:transposase
MRLDELYILNSFKITQIVKASSGNVLLQAASSSQSAICPYCHTLAKKPHGVYTRKPRSLPCSDASIQLVLSVHRYFCHNPSCSHKTFAERIPEIVHFYARRTTHLEALLKYIAFEMSAETGSRVCKRLKIQMSPDSLLRLIRKTEIDHEQAVRVPGVDDWTTKKGQSYGTILVDLERHQTIELLPSRTQTTLSEWLQKHPEIEIISRDRSFEYQAGILTYFRACRRVRHSYPSFLIGYLLESLPNLHSNAVKRCVSIFWIVKGDAFHGVAECVHTNKVYMAMGDG